MLFHLIFDIPNDSLWSLAWVQVSTYKLIYVPELTTHVSKKHTFLPLLHLFFAHLTQITIHHDYFLRFFSFQKGGTVTLPPTLMNRLSFRMKRLRGTGSLWLTLLFWVYYASVILKKTRRLKNSGARYWRGWNHCTEKLVLHHWVSIYWIICNLLIYL